MKFPELYVTVIKKLYPEIDDIFVRNYSVWNAIYDTSTYEPMENFLITVSILIARGKYPNANKEMYTDKLNSAFLHCFPEIDYIKFKVERLEFHKELTRREMFTTLFEIEKFEPLQ